MLTNRLPIHSPGNLILSALPEGEYGRLRSNLEQVGLRAGEVLYESDGRIEHVYFPDSGTISVLAVMRDGSEAEVGVVGREGMLGMPIFLGTDSAPFQAVVQVPGGGVRMRAAAFAAEVEARGALYRLLMRYAQAFFVQTAQNAGCNRLHPLAGRLARWLLMCQDRAQTDELPLTHEFLSAMLGVRRAGVTEAVNALQREGLLAGSRGRVIILDARGLGRVSCECYEVVGREFDRLLGGRTRFPQSA